MILSWFARILIWIQGGFVSTLGLHGGNQISPKCLSDLVEIATTLCSNSSLWKVVIILGWKIMFMVQSVLMAGHKTGVTKFVSQWIISDKCPTQNSIHLSKVLSILYSIQLWHPTKFLTSKKQDPTLLIHVTQLLILNVNLLVRFYIFLHLKLFFFWKNWTCPKI